MLQIDKEGANIEKAKQDMSEAGLLPEEWGGDTPMVPVSSLSQHPSAPNMHQARTYCSSAIPPQHLWSSRKLQHLLMHAILLVERAFVADERCRAR